MTAGCDPSRIVVLATELDAPGGVQAVSRSAVRALAADAPAGRRVEAWSLLDAPRRGAAGDLGGVTPRGACGRRTRLAAWALREGLRDQSGTLLLVMHLNLAPLALPWLSRGASSALLLYGIEAWRPLSPIQRLVLRRVDRVVAISAHTIERFRRANPDCADRPITICAPGIPVRARPVSTASPADGDGFALIVGRLRSDERYKGHDRLLRLWGRLREDVPGARLVIAGDGDDRERLERLSGTLGLSSAVRFVGRVSDAELQHLYDACAFVVMPSADEGFGLTFLEGMQAGRACIGGTGAASEIIVDGTTGLIVDPADDAAVLDAIRRLFLDAGLCRRMGAAGVQRFAGCFTEEQFHRRFVAALGLSGQAGADAAPAPTPSGRVVPRSGPC